MILRSLTIVSCLLACGASVAAARCATSDGVPAEQAGPGTLVFKGHYFLASEDLSIDQANRKDGAIDVCLRGFAHRLSLYLTVPKTEFATGALIVKVIHFTHTPDPAKSKRVVLARVPYNALCKEEHGRFIPGLPDDSSVELEEYQTYNYYYKQVESDATRRVLEQFHAELGDRPNSFLESLRGNLLQANRP